MNPGVEKNCIFVCRAIGLWSALKKKPICTTQLAHGVGGNGVANWITAIAVVVNTDLVATGK